MKSNKKHLIGLANAFISGTPYRIPFGLVPNQTADGKRVIQRLSRENAQLIVNELKEERAAKGDQFPGYPVYIGHPDHPSFRDRDQDMRAFGWNTDISLSNAALEMIFDWPPAGEELLTNKHFKFLSPHFMCVMSNEKQDGVPIVDIIGIRSIGLTNNPNWPGLATLVNEQIAGEAAGTEEGDGMKFLERLAKALGMDPATATEEEVAAAIEAMCAENADMCNAINECWPPENEDRVKLGDKPKGADLIKGMANACGKKAVTTANEKIGALELKVTTAEAAATGSAAQIQTANERIAIAIDGTLDLALAAGRITLADRETWKGKLTAGFANAAKELVALKPVVKTTVTPGIRAPASLGVGRQAEQLALVNELLPLCGGQFDKAWAAAKAKHPDLFKE